MLNLLPTEQKAEIKKEYSTRRIIVWLGLITGVLCISLVLLLPSYFLSRIKANEVRGELESTKAILENDLQPQNVTNEISAAITHAEALKPFKEDVSPYELIRIFENKSPSIKITTISYTNRGGVSAEGIQTRPEISIQGKAADRDSLTAFGKLVEGREEFSDVEIPVSNFVKERDIIFSMTVKVK